MTQDTSMAIQTIVGFLTLLALTRAALSTCGAQKAISYQLMKFPLFPHNLALLNGGRIGSPTEMDSS
jgi:hypothetical protein